MPKWNADVCSNLDGANQPHEFAPKYVSWSHQARLSVKKRATYARFLSHRREQQPTKLRHRREDHQLTQRGPYYQDTYSCATWENHLKSEGANKIVLHLMLTLTLRTQNTIAQIILKAAVRTPGLAQVANKACKTQGETFPYMCFITRQASDA